MQSPRRERRIQVIEEFLVAQGINSRAVRLQSSERFDVEVDTGARELPTPVERINEPPEVGDQQVQQGPTVRDTLGQ
jgi:hypothetical protein